MDPIPIQEPEPTQGKPPKFLDLALYSLADGRQSEAHMREGRAVTRKTAKWLRNKPLSVRLGKRQALFTVMEDSGRPLLISSQVSGRLKAWATDGFYYQAGFLSLDHTRSIVATSTVAIMMMVYDELYESTGLIDPKALQRDTEPMFPIRHSWELLNSNLCVWRKELVKLRNQALIGARAIANGLDPDVEYERFVNAGGKYFLEYPELCH